MARDWLKDLWPASYKGAAFWTERDQESGGRRIVKHQFPMRDLPFLEDLGEDLREFDVTAYVASDAADAEALAVVAACSSRGAGMLVMPVQGPVLVRCTTWSRDSFKDRAGYIAFSLKFCREGASTPLVTVAMAANLVFVAAEAMAGAIALDFAASLAIAGMPDYVVSAAVGQLQTVVATLDAVRVTEPVEPVASAVQRRAIEALFDAVPNIVVTPAGVAGAAEQVAAIERALGDAMPPATALRVFEAIAGDADAAQSVVPVLAFDTPGRRSEYANSVAVFRLVRRSALTAYSEAIARVDLADRPSGITLRANLAEFFEAEMLALPPERIDLVRAVEALRDSVIAYLSRKILDLAPVVHLQANQSMPSVFWAYRLYQDPERALELVERNGVVHPSFMPAEFEALAPS